MTHLDAARQCVQRVQATIGDRKAAIVFVAIGRNGHWMELNARELCALAHDMDVMAGEGMNQAPATE